MRTPVRTLRRSLTAIAGTLLLGAGSAHAAPPPTEVIGKPSLKGAGTVYGYPDGAVTARHCGQVAPVRNTDLLTCPPDWKLSDPSGTDTAGRELRLYALPEPGWKLAGWEHCPALTASGGCSLYAAQGTTERFAPVALFEDDQAPGVTGLVAGPSATRDRAVAADWGATEASTYRCAIDGGGLAPCAPPFSFDAADGTHQFVVQATDLNGLKSSLTRITAEMVDTELLTAPVDGAYVATRASEVVGRSASGSTFECAVDADPYATCGRADGLGRARLRLPDLADGQHTLRVRARRGADVEQVPATRSWTVDTVAPDTTISARDGGFELGSDEAAVAFRCGVDGAAPVPCASPFAPPVGPGAHALQVIAVDRAGNADASPATHGWSVAAPVAAPRPRISFTLRYTWRKGRFTRLAAVGLPTGTPVKVSVKCPRKQGCPRGGSLARLIGKRLQPGTKITVRAAGTTRTITIRRDRAPRVG